MLHLTVREVASTDQNPIQPEFKKIEHKTTYINA